MKNNHIPRMPQDYPPARHIHFFGCILGISNFCAGLSCRIPSSHSSERMEIHAVGMQILIKYTEMYARHLPCLYFVEVFGHLQINPNPCIACESLSITGAFRAILLFYFSTISLWLFTDLLSTLKNHAHHATPITSPACGIVDGVFAFPRYIMKLKPRVPHET
jgi:cellulose synthase/poly-beta-1,6-N-acetylglucosamine synthase-like glycosyltransferase